jgi:TetR/AcrR family transcriptional repressor of nem operon
MTDRSRTVQRPRKKRDAPRVGRPPTPGLREALLASGLASMHVRGYHATGVAEIALGAHAPKGAFYSQFASKDDFGLVVVDHFASGMLAALRASLWSTAEPSPLRRIRGYFAARVAHYRVQGCSKGCLLGNFALELSDESEPIRERVEFHLKAFARSLAETLESAQLVGEVRRDHQASRLARMLVRAWEGALLAMRAQKSVAPLTDFVELMIDDFLVH